MTNTISPLKYFFRNNSLLVIAFTFLLVAVTINRTLIKPSIKVDRQSDAFNFNTSFLKLLSSGNKRIISSTIWIQTLLESDQEKYNRKDYESWMYLRFLTIASLDPRFYENYLYGGMYLSVVKNDLLGAADIFERGLEYYPQDYRLNYYSGFNYFFELGDYEKGFEKLQRIENHPHAPPLLRQIVSKLRFETSGDYEVALQFLKENLKLVKDDMIREKLSKDIYAVAAQRDLECLNEGRKNCSMTDAYGIPYIKDEEGKWKSKVPFNPYKIFRPKFKDQENGMDLENK